MSDVVTAVAFEEAPAPPKKKPGRPRKLPTVPSLTDDQFSALLQALTADRKEGIDAETLKSAFAEAAIISAKTMQKAMKPENVEAPGCSAFSYPEGDLARPRPVLPFELFWKGYPMHMFPETEHWRELELACELTPGVYPVIRKDGSKMTVTITADKDADGKVTKLELGFDETREDKWLTPPKIVTLYQIVHGQNRPPRQVFMEAMTEYYALMFGEAKSA